MSIGIDLGGNSIKGGLVNKDGKIMQHYQCITRTEAGYFGIVADILDVIKKLIQDSDKNETQVGIGVPGILSGDSKTILSCPNLSWENLPLKKDLEENLEITVHLVNDANAACIAESAFGSTKNRLNAMMITLGTGVGGGLILNGRLITGVHGVATEIGHMVLEKNFYDCACGKNGCLETFASATALLKYFKMRLKKGATSKLRDDDCLEAQDIFDAAKTKDPLANEAVNRLANYLGMAISNINDVIDPGIFSIGGGLSNAGDFLLDKIKKSTQNYLTYPKHANPEIVLASCKNEAGIIGAAMLKNYL